MHTSPWFERSSIIRAAFLLVAALATVVVAQSTVWAVEGKYPQLPASDIAKLGDDMLFGVQQGSPAVEGSTAIDLASREYDPIALGATGVDAYLATITMPGTFKAASPIRDRSVWIVRLGGLRQQAGAPMGEDGPAALKVLTVNYVVVDAETGEFLLAIWME